jgi:hypothetical protein
MTTDSVKIKFFMAGEGTVSVDFGDGSEKETRALLTFDEDFYDDDRRDKFAYSHIYSDTSSRTITVVGENITHFVCNNYRLTELDVSRSTALLELDCDENIIQNLNVSENFALKKLFCSKNQLTKLDVINNTALSKLLCGDNLLTELNLCNNTELTGLICKNNQLESLNVSNNKSLTGLGCGNNLLTNLDVTNNPALTWLLCDDNRLRSLDVSRNTKLVELQCQNNQIKSLDVSACTELKQIKSHSNPMPCLDEFLSRLRTKGIRTQEIEPNRKHAILSSMYKIEGGMYPVCLVADNDKFYLTDDGATYEELDKIFELSEADVIKNLKAILQQYGCSRQKSNNAFIIECTPQDVHLKLSYLTQCLSFMLNMKIFYV